MATRVMSENFNVYVNPSRRRVTQAAGEGTKAAGEGIQAADEGPKPQAREYIL